MLVLVPPVKRVTLQIMEPLLVSLANLVVTRTCLDHGTVRFVQLANLPKMVPNHVPIVQLVDSLIALVQRRVPFVVRESSPLMDHLCVPLVLLVLSL